MASPNLLFILSRYNIDAAAIHIFQNKMFIRISAQVYNQKSDYLALADAMVEIINDEKLG